MSTLKVNNLQVGQDGTAANNYTLYQPASPDGTVRLGYGVSGSVTDILTLKNSRLGIGTNNPSSILHLQDGNSTVIHLGNTSYDDGVIQYFNGSIALKTGSSNGDRTFQVHTAGTERLRINLYGTLGVGCVPNDIQDNFDAVQIGGNLILNVDSTGVGAGVYMSNNVYRDRTNSRWEYINTDEATQYVQANGEHIWRYAASGNADSAITWSEALRITTAGNVRVPDNGKFTAGAGDDLQIWSDNTDQYIRGEQNQLLIRSNNLKLQSYLGENYIHAANNNAVSLYYDNSKKLETTLTGAMVTGNFEPEADATRDLGSTSLRWANIYSADLQLSNEGAANDVDGTWGQYTIQEGEDDLFLINRRNGKKYKFMLQEVN